MKILKILNSKPTNQEHATTYFRKYFFGIVKESIQLPK